MRYPNLPPVGGAVLPDLEWMPTTAYSTRRSPVETVWLHRWGIVAWQWERISGVEGTFMNRKNQASSHIVYAGEIGPDAGKCVQMVALAKASWTEAYYNGEGVSVECGDAMWLGHDPAGFCRTARIVGWLLKDQGLPPAWVRNPSTHLEGFCRHADGGAAGGGHTQCPTTDLELWGQFVERVKAECARGGYRPVWAR